MTDTSTAVREIMLNDGGDKGWVRMPLVGPDGGVQFSDLARFQPKILFGDPSKDDNDLLSSWQLSDLSGGSGVYDMKEGTDAGRYFMSTMATRFPAQLTKPPYANVNLSAPAGDKRVLGELYGVASNQVFFIYMAGLNVRRARMNSYAIDGTYLTPSSGNLTNVPVQKGVNFQGTAAEEYFFIPQGNNGYATITETSVAPTEYASPKFKSFAIWDNKLIGVTTGGRLYYTLDAATWVAYDLTFQLSESYYIRGIVNFFDRRDEPCLYIITGRDMWQFDPDGPELFRIDFGWPTHPHHGEAFCVWQGQLYIAVGMGVFRYTSGTWMPIGLDRDDGLPAEYQGYIMDLIPGYNAMYAVVQGVDKGSEYGAKSSIQEFTSNGWHCFWQQDTAVPSSDQYHGQLAQTPYTMGWAITTRAGTGGEYTLVWGTMGSDDTLYTSPLSTTFANPRAGIQTGQLFDSGSYYYWESPEFDADMMGYIKIANAWQIYIEEPIAITGGDRDTVRLLYRVDRGSWVLLAEQEALPGRYAFPFGNAIGIERPTPGHPDTTLYQGVSWEKIQFRLEILKGAVVNADKPAVITNQVFSFLKTVSSNDSFQVTVDTRMGSLGDEPMGPTELQEYIDTLTSIKRFALMKLGQYTYRVFVAQNGGTRYGSDAQQGLRSLSLVEIPAQL